MPDGSGLGLPADSVCEDTATSSSRKACVCLVGSVLRHISPYLDSTRGSNGTNTSPAELAGVMSPPNPRAIP